MTTDNEAASPSILTQAAVPTPDAQDALTDREKVWNDIDDGSAGNKGDLDRDIDLDKHDFMPWSGRFVVEVFPPSTSTRGGIHIPSQATTAKSWGRIVSVGPKCGEVRVGDLILFIYDAGVPLDIIAPNLRLLEWRDDFENDVLGVFKPRGVDTGTLDVE